jgi:hypothetical protein
MDSAIEERVTQLEAQVAELTRQVLGVKPREKDWRRTVGMLPHDEMSLEADRLGHEWRMQQRDP